jgi:aryl-alcohol dehydrogenase-like predicted oxidoreductase
MNKKIENIDWERPHRKYYINLRHGTPIENTSLSEFRRGGISILEDAYHKGVLFDASPGYGLIESLLIEWLQQKSDPDVAIATKWGLSLANFDKNAKVHELKEHSIKKLNFQWEFSKNYCLI